MADGKTNSPEELLKKELEEAQSTSLTDANSFTNITRVNQFIYDYAQSIDEVLQTEPEAINIEAQIVFWRSINKSRRSLEDDIVRIDGIMMSVSGTATTSSSDAYESISSYRPSYQNTNEFSAIPIPTTSSIEKLKRVILQTSIKEEVENILLSWKFNNAAPGIVSPYENFRIAYSGYETPVTANDPVITSLIPIRECIEGILEELNRKKPVQEETKNDYNKVISIGRQLKRDEVDIDVVAEWANQWINLKKQLSGTKDKVISREVWGATLQQATRLISSLLKLLNQDKLRS